MYLFIVYPFFLHGKCHLVSERLLGQSVPHSEPVVLPINQHAENSEVTMQQFDGCASWWTQGPDIKLQVIYTYAIDDDEKTIFLLTFRK